MLLSGKRQDNILHLAERRCRHIFHQWNAAPQSQNMNTVGLAAQSEKTQQIMETFLLKWRLFYLLLSDLTKVITVPKNLVLSDQQPTMTTM